MPAELPYLSSYKNVEKLFSGIASAKIPDAFTHRFLSETLGLGASTDRPLIPFLRTLGFLDAANHPTPEYSNLKNSALAKKAIAAAVKRAYAPLFAANENAHKVSGDALKGLIAQVAGSDEGMTKKIAGTFNALGKLADYSGTGAAEDRLKVIPKIQVGETETAEGEGTMRPEFHYNIQIHLPANASEETYLSIFNAVRKVFK